MPTLQERVIKTQYKPNCYILVSFSKKDPKDTGGDFRVKSIVSFVYDAGEYAAEWEPEYGPIQVWHKCAADAEGAKENYFYPYTDSPGGNWSQLAVDDNELPSAANRGDWDYIFSILQNWAQDR